MMRHLIGIGGVGMSALATALVRMGDEVTGADRTRGTPNVRFLESLGVRVFPDDGSGVDAATDEVIVSTAIEPTNAGLVRGRRWAFPSRTARRRLRGRWRAAGSSPSDDFRSTPSTSACPTVPSSRRSRRAVVDATDTPCCAAPDATPSRVR